MTETFVVAGGGFRGFCDALELSKRPNSKIHIVEPAPFFGGVMHSFMAEGFHVDKGVHVFDSIPKDLAKVVDEIMEGQTREIDFVSASAFNNQVTDGFSLPDLASLDDETKAKIAYELVQLASRPDRQAEANTLRELFEARYGRTASDIFCNVFFKVYGIEADEVEAKSISQTSMGRLKFLDDAEMHVLKSNPRLEDVLAARRKTMGKVDDFVSIYPDTGEAMTGWCTRAVTWLVNKGIEVHLGESIESLRNIDGGVEVKTSKRSIQASQVLWSNDNTAALSKVTGIESSASESLYGTPLMFLVMVTQADQIKDFTYLQNFDIEGVTYRTSSAGLFSNQITEDGRSFITSECPVKIGSSFWENPESMIEPAWRECKDLGIIGEKGQLLASKAIPIPSSFKLPKLGYTDKVNELTEKVRNKYERVVLRNVVPFFRRDIYLDSLKLDSYLK